MSVSDTPSPAATAREDDPLVARAQLHASLNSAELERLFPRRTEFELVSSDQTPEYLRYPDVLDGYRVHFCTSLCFKSLVRLHTETFNVWSHLGGAVGFLAFFVWAYRTYLQFYGFFHALLITLYALCCVWLFLCSATFHLFACHSPYAAHCTGLLDYRCVARYHHPQTNLLLSQRYRHHHSRI